MQAPPTAFPRPHVIGWQEATSCWRPGGHSETGWPAPYQPCGHQEALRLLIKDRPSSNREWGNGGHQADGWQTHSPDLGFPRTPPSLITGKGTATLTPARGVATGCTPQRHLRDSQPALLWGDCTGEGGAGLWGTDSVAECLEPCFQTQQRPHLDLNRPAQHSPGQQEWLL